MPQNITKYSLFIILLWHSAFAFAQKEGNIWYFGNGAGLNFNFSPPKKMKDGKLRAHEGTASISDKNGDLLFYTDGVTIWTKTHTIMSNGTGLYGDKGFSSKQAALIVKQPNTNNYFVFTTSAEYKYNSNKKTGVYYSVVNMDIGEGIVIRKNIILTDSSCEAISATMHANGKDIWVAIGEYKKGIHTFLLTSDSIVKIKNQISPLLSLGLRVAFKFSPNGKYFTCSDDKIYLFEFNNLTGKYSNRKTVDNAYSYSLAFSSNSKWLYFNGKNSIWDKWTKKLLLGASIYRINCDSINTTRTLKKEFISSDFLRWIVAINLGPDDNIYLITTNAYSTKGIRVIKNPNENNPLKITILDIKYTSPIVRAGLPNNLNYSYPRLIDSIICNKNKYQLKIIRNDIDSIQWNFNNTEYFTTTTSSIVRNMTTAGEKYWLKVYANGAMYELEDSNKYTPLPIIELGNDTLLCKKETLNISLNTTTETIQWEDGSTAPKRLIKANPDNYKNLKVEVSNKYCTTTDSIKIRFVACGIQSQYLCKGDSTSIVLNESIIDKAEWDLGNGAIKTTLTNTVKHKYSQKGKHVFSVIITHNGLNKTLTDSVFITELEGGFLMDKDTFCEPTLIAPNLTKNYLYSWNTGSTEKSILADKGWYVLTISKNGCSVTDSTFISNTNCECNVYIPNSFTPNGDGLNDVFKLETNCAITQLQLHIYNRWGEKLYQSGNKREVNWDGKYKNEACQNGIYIWRVSYITSQGVRKNRSGNIYLMR